MKNSRKKYSTKALYGIMLPLLIQI